MAASDVLAFPGVVRTFIDEYYEAWCSNDEARILAYYAETESMDLRGMYMNGKAALRAQFVRTFIAAL